MDAPLALFISVASAGMWAFIAVTTWSDARRREREAYYKSETIKKAADMPGESGIALLREVERNSMRRRRENLKLGGLVTAAAGFGLLIFLGMVAKDTPAPSVGIIPILIGAALLFYAYVLAPKE